MSLFITLASVTRSSVRASVASFTPWGLVHSDWAVVPRKVVGGISRVVFDGGADDCAEPELTGASDDE